MEKTTLRTTLKIFSIICVVIAALAIIGSIIDFDSESGYALVGGGILLAQGWLALVYISKE